MLLLWSIIERSSRWCNWWMKSLESEWTHKNWHIELAVVKGQAKTKNTFYLLTIKGAQLQYPRSCFGLASVMVSRSKHNFEGFRNSRFFDSRPYWKRFEVVLRITCDVLWFSWSELSDESGPRDSQSHRVEAGAFRYMRSFEKVFGICS